MARPRTNTAEKTTPPPDPRLGIRHLKERLANLVDEETGESMLPPIPEFKRDLAKAKLLSLDNVRYLVDTYYQSQQRRIRGASELRSALVDDEPHEWMVWPFLTDMAIENFIRAALGQYAETSVRGRWLTSLTGIGPVIAAGLVAHFDVRRAPTVGHWYRFAGLDPSVVWLGREKAAAFVKEQGGERKHFDYEAICELAILQNRKPANLWVLVKTINLAPGALAPKDYAAHRASILADRSGTVSRGDVAKALARRPWNARAKLLCVRPDQRVTTTRGHIPIADVRVGDEVLTHRGRWRPVTEVLSREFRGDLIGLRARGCANQVAWVTPEHPIYGMHRAGYRWPRVGRTDSEHWRLKPLAADAELEWPHAGSIQGGDIGFVPRVPSDGTATLEMVDRGTIPAPGGQLLVTGRYATVAAPRAFPMPAQVPVTEEFAELIGLYVSEGHVSGNIVGFSFHRRETALMDFVLRVARRDCGVRGAVQHFEGKLAAQVIICAKILATTLSELCGHGARTKHFPHDWHSAPPSVKAALLRGAFLGDGSFRRGDVRLATVSAEVALQARDMLGSLGITASVHQEECESRALRVLVHDDRRFYATVMGRDIETMKCGARVVRSEPEGSWVSFRRPVTAAYAGTVYNLEVEEDHSYVVEGYAVHNCWKLGTSFAYQKHGANAFYSHFIAERKAYEKVRNDRGDNAQYAARQLTERTYDRGTVTYQALASGKISDGQIDARGRRWAVKMCLSHYHAVSFFEEYGRLPATPYAIAHLGHTDEIAIPNMELVPGLAEAWSKREHVDRFRVYERDGGQCGLCPETVPREDFAVYYRTPLAAGGRETYENSAVAHRPCLWRREAA